MAYFCVREHSPCLSGCMVLSVLKNFDISGSPLSQQRRPRSYKSSRSVRFVSPQQPPKMFTNDQRQAERTGRSGTPRAQYLQDLVAEFQKTSNEESKERIVSNLANFAYDPYNYSFLRQLNVLELFLDCITETNEKLIEFGIGGICNSSADPENAAIIVQCHGIPLVVQCLSSPVGNTVTYALGALYYLCNSSTKKDIMKPEIVELIRRYAAAGSVNVNFSNLANAILDVHVNQ